MFRRFLLLASTLIVFGAWTAGASAASLSVSAADAQAPDPLTVSYSGTADEPGSITVLAELDGTTCEADWGTHRSKRQIAFRSVNRPVPAGPLSGTIEAPAEAQAPSGRYMLCAYLDRQNAIGTQALAAASVNYTALPPDVGFHVSTRFFSRLDLLNSVMLQYNGTCRGQGGCAGEHRPAGMVTVKLAASSKKKLKLRSATLLRGAVHGCGAGSFCATLKASKAVKRRLRAAHRAAGEKHNGFGGVEVKATVTFKQTAPFEQTVSQKVTLKSAGSARMHASCRSTNARFPCPDSP